MGQNLPEGATGEPQAGQGRASGAPHDGQKVADSRTWEPHDEQDRMAHYGPMLPALLTLSSKSLQRPRRGSFLG